MLVAAREMEAQYIVRSLQVSHCHHSLSLLTLESVISNATQHPVGEDAHWTG